MSLRILAIVGPTASGKSALALAVAERLPIEIVSCDSQQVYVGMDVGTGKPSAEQRRTVPHHLLDTVLPSEQFHAARWAALARPAIEHIAARGRVPVVVGGSGLYLRALLFGLFAAPPPDPAIRRRHRDDAQRLGTEHAYARLVEVDPETARRVQPRDMVRISRALEVFEQTGVPISEHYKRTNVSIAAEGVAATTLILDPPLNVLRERIACRFDAMMAAGFLDETRRLRVCYGPDARPLQALGYKQLGEYMDGLLTLDEAVAAAKAATVAYARRQRTWFRKESDAWRVEATPDPDTVVRWWHAATGQRT